MGCVQRANDVGWKKRSQQCDNKVHAATPARSLASSCAIPFLLLLRLLSLAFDTCITALASPASASSVPRSREEAPEEKEIILLACISFWPLSMRCQSIENVTRPHGPRPLAHILRYTVPGNCQHPPEELGTGRGASLGVPG
jgi:hypothetical protein